MATDCFPTNIHLSRPIPKESVRIETRCCIFKRMIIDWTNTEVTGISGMRIEMPNEAKISIFTDNDLTHITDDHFEIKLVARLLDQIYVVPSPQSPPRYDDIPSDIMSFTQTVNNTGMLYTSGPVSLKERLLYTLDVSCGATVIYCGATVIYCGATVIYCGAMI